MAFSGPTRLVCSARVSVKAAIKFWQDAVAMGGTPQGEA